MTSPRPVAERPPWWRWYEPPRWFPSWLHLLTCSHCRSIGDWLDSDDGQRWLSGARLSDG